MSHMWEQIESALTEAAYATENGWRVRVLVLTHIHAFMGTLSQ
jgi:hypothetical protein